MCTHTEGEGGGVVVWQRWKKSVCFSMSHWRRLSCIPLHIPSSRARPLQTNRKKNTEKKHGPAALYRGPTQSTHTHKRTLSHALWPPQCLIQAHPTQGDWVCRKRILLSSTEKKNVRATFVVLVLSLTLSLLPPPVSSWRARSPSPSFSPHLHLFPSQLQGVGRVREFRGISRNKVSDPVLSFFFCVFSLWIFQSGACWFVTTVIRASQVARHCRASVGSQGTSTNRNTSAPVIMMSVPKRR